MALVVLDGAQAPEANVSKLTDLLKDVAPTIAGALGTGVGGPIVGAAFSALSSKLLGRPDASHDEVAQAIQALPPDKLIELRKLDTEFQEKMLEHGYSMAELGVRDRDSARQREIQTHDSWTPRALAALVIVGAFVGEGYAMTHVIPAGSEVLIGRILGTLDSALMLVLSYYFGSSIGSDRKTELMAATAKRAE